MDYTHEGCLMRWPFPSEIRQASIGAALEVRASIPAGSAVLILALGFLMGCTGSGDTTLYSSDVYVTGYESNGTVQVAKYWKNGTAIPLTDGTHGALALGIVVSGQDVYVAGGEDNGTVDVAKYWKNGVPIALTDGTNQAFAVGIAVSGSDVYVTGYETDPSKYGIAVAKVWKNGVPLALTDGSGEAQANAVVVDGTDVHVAGWEYQEHEISPNSYLLSAQAVYWKNGAKTTLTGFANGGGAQGMAISASDVFICGNEFSGSNGVAKVWKNGTATPLTDGSLGAEASGIVVLGGNIFVSGYEETSGGQIVALLWKNITPNTLSTAPFTTVANGVALAPMGASVYVAGTVYGPAASVAIYWQDGQPRPLTKGTNEAEALGIAVVQKAQF
jgi:hypothetical protein